MGRGAQREIRRAVQEAVPGLDTIACRVDAGHVGFHGATHMDSVARPERHACRLCQIRHWLDAHADEHQIGGGGESL